MFKLDNWIKRAVFVGLAAGAALFASAFPAGAATAPALGTAASFAVLGGSTVTNTGATTIGGNLGVSPGTAVANTGSFIFTNTGAEIVDPAVTLQAQTDAAAADLALKGGTNACGEHPVNTALTGTLAPGAYCYDSSVGLTGTVTLDAGGNPGAVFIFNTVSTLTTAAGSTVSLTGGANACNVFWNIGSSATLGAGTSFKGTIIAYASITLATGASVNPGRAIAQTGAVTMDANNVTIPKGDCPVKGTPTNTPVVAPPTATPGAVGGSSFDPAGGGQGSSGLGSWYVAAASAAGVLALGGAAWYVRRRVQ